MVSTGSSDIASSFRAKATTMKTWKPASNPSNRDRLELYSLHKQAINGDAPASFPSTASGPEKAKYQAWRAKNGMPTEEAMRLYLQESDRQLRVYGTAKPQITNDSSTNSGTGNSDASSSSNTSSSSVPRGLAAVPLLCAAALETRSAYIRRLAQTPVESAWWKRQEPLCSAPRTVGAIPEMILLLVARLVEFLSLNVATASHVKVVLPSNMIQAFFWPVHNCLLSVWMGVALVHTTITSAGSCLQTIVWGARRTGVSLTRVWNDEILLCATSISAMCEAHQALTCRLVGLFLLPLAIVVGLLSGNSRSDSTNGNQAGTLTCAVYCCFLICTWWYWLLVLPWLASCVLGIALANGFCFALIELAGV